MLFPRHLIKLIETITISNHLKIILSNSLLDLPISQGVQQYTIHGQNTQNAYY